MQTWALNHLACFCEKPGVLFLGTRTKLEQKDIKLQCSQGANCCHWNSFCQNHAGCRRLCCCHECDSPWPIPVQQFLDHVRMPWIPSDRFSCHVVLCTSICSLLVVRRTSHAEVPKQLVLEHRCQPCQPCQIMPGDPVDLRNSSEHMVPSKCRCFRLPVIACSFCTSVVVTKTFSAKLITLTSLSAPAPPRKSH